MSVTLTRLYDTYDEAKSAVNALEAAGIEHEDISILARNAGDLVVADDDSGAATGAGTGAGIGGLLGGGAGLLAGLGMLAIPGVGPVVAAGWLVATVAGAATGAVAGGATGGIIGALTDSGVEERHAHVYAEGLRRGGTLVTARVHQSQVATAQGVLDRHNPVDLEVRAAAYREGGWDAFDETAASPYIQDEFRRRCVG